MHRPILRALAGRIGASGCALVLGAFGAAALSPIALARPAGHAARLPAAGQISARPASGTPELAPTGVLETVRQLKQCGPKMYAVGSFSSIRHGSEVYARSNIFSFSATPPYQVTSWDPQVNGTVNTIAFDGSNCLSAYIGGDFTSVNGVAARNIAKIGTTTDAVRLAFTHHANKPVDTMVVSGSHLLTGGAFTAINGTPRQYYASLNLRTGRDDGYLHLDLAGTYQYQGVAPNVTLVYNQQVSHAGHRVLVEGDFTTAGGQPRQQIFMLSLGQQAATVTGWTSPDFDEHCVTTEPFYVRAAAWAPGDNAVYTATTGDHVYLWNGQYPLTGPCDATTAFSAGEQSQQPQWVNYTGCDSLYSALAYSGTVFVAGHPRWSQNQDGCNEAGPGAVADPGLQGLEAGSGSVERNAQGQAVYTMGRANADDMLLGTQGLWIASGNRDNSDVCGGVGGHAGICLLPFS